jgi:hypothetical protein
MKNSPATDSPISLVFLNDFTNQKTSIRTNDLLKPPARPTEEMISRLNRIGNEYPFCVYYKQKLNDPL